MPATIVAHRALRWAFLRLLERSGPGFYGAVVCRTRAIDDECRRALAAGVARVVILGAGLDTRAYRLPAMRAARVWELDLPAVQEAKKAALGELPEHVTYAPVDLVRQRVGDVLADSGAATLVLFEAVSMYLPGDAVDRVLAYAGGLVPGSRVVLTYMPRGFLDDPRYARWARRLGWRTAFDPAELAVRLAGHGLRVLADLGAEEHQERLLRPLGRRLAVFGGERIVVAEPA